MRISILFLLLMLGLCAKGTVLTVPTDYGSVQSAVDNAQYGDTIVLLQGEYFENLHISTKNIVLASQFIFTNDELSIEQTILNGGGVNSCIVIDSIAANNSKIIGLTIKNGYNHVGAGIRINGVDIEISNCIIEDNESYWYGLGNSIYMNNSQSIIQNNIIRNSIQAYEGGGIYLNYCDSVFILNNQIYGHETNSGDGVSAGAGVFIENSTHIHLKKNLFHSNYSDYGWGDHVTFKYTDAFIEGCTFYSNMGRCAIENYSSSISIKNSILWAKPGFQGWIFSDTANLNVTYCDVMQFVRGEGNFSQDPEFDNFNDFSLSQTSPCINSGDPTYAHDPDGSVVDLGWNYFDLSSYGTIKGVVSLNEGIGTLENIFIICESDTIKPLLRDGSYSFFTQEGTYQLKAYLGIHQTIAQGDIYVSGNDVVGGVDFHFANTDQNLKIDVNKDGTGHFISLQRAIEWSLTHDTIHVFPGEYEGATDLYGKSVVFISDYFYTNQSIDIDNTILRGKNSRIFNIADVSDSLLMFQGFTFLEGYGTNGGGCEIKHSQPVFKNCNFLNNESNNYGGAVFNLYSDSKFYDCLFENNEAYLGGAVYNFGSNPILVNCTFIDNSASSGGAVINNISSSAEIDKCFFQGNISSNGAGSAVMNMGGKSTISNCIFKDNYSSYGGTVYFKSSAQGYIVNSLFDSNNTNSSGGAIRIRMSSPLIVNNTIVNNVAQEEGGGLYFEDYCYPKFYNNIIWGNSSSGGNQICISSTNSNPSFYYSTIQDGLSGFSYINTASPANFEGDYYYNSMLDPVFQDEGNFQLSENSPCIDAGTLILPDGFSLPETDLIGNPRIDGGLDRGAYEHAPLGISSNFNSDDKGILAYPNPFSNAITLQFDLEQNAYVEVSIFDIYGKLIKNIFVGYLPSGVQSFNWAGSTESGVKLASGLYLCSFTINGREFSTMKISLKR
ncbi:MAG: hypothetical protein C0599_15040 [Salinivirgaceae bacterium]|nr:MAG: hypothetical protein C0599_15040 [Salinivirgaceae bacterium]